MNGSAITLLSPDSNGRGGRPTGGTDSASPSTRRRQGATDDSETRRYRNTLDGVYRLFDTVALPPAAAAVESCGHALAAMSQAPAKAERCKALPQAVATTNVVHLMNTTMRGVTHSPLDPPGRGRVRMLRSGGIMSPFPRPPSHSTGPSTTGSTTRQIYRKRTHYTRTPCGRSYGGEGPGIPVERLGGCHASQFRGDQSPRLVRSLGVPGR